MSTSPLDSMLMAFEKSEAETLAILRSPSFNSSNCELTEQSGVSMTASFNSSNPSTSWGGHVTCPCGRRVHLLI